MIIENFLKVYDRKGLSVQQAAIAVKVYKSHHQIPTIGEVLKAVKVQEKPVKAGLALLDAAAAWQDIRVNLGLRPPDFGYNFYLFKDMLEVFGGPSTGSQMQPNSLF
jgi:hypothetical protein